MFWYLQNDFKLASSFIWTTKCLLPSIWGHSGKKGKTLPQSLQQRSKGINMKWKICPCYNLEVRQQWKGKSGSCFPPQLACLWVQRAVSSGCSLRCEQAVLIAVCCIAGRQKTFGAYGIQLPCVLELDFIKKSERTKPVHGFVVCLLFSAYLQCLPRGRFYVTY